MFGWNQSKQFFYFGWSALTRTLNAIVEAFKSRVIGSGGTFEAYDCMATQIDELLAQPQIVTTFNLRVVSEGGTFESANCMQTIVTDSQNLGFYDETSLFVTPNGYKANKIFSNKPTDSTGNLDVFRNSPAMKRSVNKLWDTVSNNIPRLHYPVTGDCPKWLLESLVTNLLTNSNNYGNASWIKAPLVIIAGQTISPSTIASTKIYPLVSNVNVGFRTTFLTSVSTTYTKSVRARFDGIRWIAIASVNNGNFTWFDIQNGVLGTVGSGVTARITPDTNGFYLCEVTSTATSTTGNFRLIFANSNGSTAVTASGSNGAYFWNCQAEEGIVATSPIITGSTSVTRLSDRIDSTLDEIGGFEGTFYFEGSFNSNVGIESGLVLSSGIFGIFDSSAILVTRASNGIIYLSYTAQYNSPIYYFGPTIALNTFFKVAVVYKNGFLPTFFVNGVEYNADNPSSYLPLTDPLTMFYTYNYGSETFSANLDLGPTQLFKIALSQAEGIAITTL
jgi:hypothetical protein